MKTKTEFLTLVHYKEPLRKVEQGHGYYGAIQITLDRGRIQCHECGELFANLSAHVRQKHKITAPEYREKFQLAHGTALVSEKERARMKEMTVKFLESMTPEEKEEYKQNAILRGREAQKPRKKTQPKDRLETKNKRGTCPDQLLERGRQLAKKIGRTPTLADLIEDSKGSQRWKHVILTTFGTWNKYVKMLGLKPNTAHKGTPGKAPPRYHDEELLEYLKIFFDENGKLPTETDFKRKLLPPSETYRRRFGSIPKARALAGLPEID